MGTLDILVLNGRSVFEPENKPYKDTVLFLIELCGDCLGENHFGLLHDISQCDRTSRLSSVGTLHLIEFAFGGCGRSTPLVGDKGLGGVQARLQRLLAALGSEQFGLQGLDMTALRGGHFRMCETG